MSITTYNANPMSQRMNLVAADASVSKALWGAGLNFSVETVELHSPILTADGAGLIDFTEHRGIVRADSDGTLSPLAVVGKNYRVIQNYEAFAPIDTLRAEGLIERIDQVGCTEGGKRVFMLAKLSSECRLEDPHQRMLMFTTSHDGSGATSVRAWSERLFCANQFPVVFGHRFRSRRKSTFSVRHTKNAQEYLKQMHSAVLSSITLLDEHELTLEKLMNTPVTDAQVDTYVKTLFPYPPADGKLISRARDNVTRKRATFKFLAVESKTNLNVRHTAAALFNAATEYSDHYARGNRADRILLGRDVDFKQRALDLALAIAE